MSIFEGVTVEELEELREYEQESVASGRAWKDRNPGKNPLEGGDGIVLQAVTKEQYEWWRQLVAAAPALFEAVEENARLKERIAELEEDAK